MVTIGTMIGRLSEKIDDKIQAFPTNSWKNEFELAQKHDFDVIEWILDMNENPIMKNGGINEIRTLSKNHGIKINSICCDNFMEKPLFRISESELGRNLDLLEYLINTCQKLEIKYLEIPLVDSSSIKSENEEFEFIKNIHIKDRKFGGNTVEFGKGDTDFEKFFQSLSKIRYSGD